MSVWTHVNGNIRVDALRLEYGKNIENMGFMKLKGGFKMNAKELVGKRAIRTKPVMLENGSFCRSYTDDYVTIIKATDSHIIYKWSDKFLKVCQTANDDINIMSYEYCDENWIDYDELISGI